MMANAVVQRHTKSQKSRYIEGFLAGQAITYCEAISRGSRLVAQMSFPKMYAATLIRLIALEGCRSTICLRRSGRVKIWIYRDPTAKRFVKRLTSKPGPVSALDIWSMGKFFGYADREVIDYAKRSM